MSEVAFIRGFVDDLFPVLSESFIVQANRDAERRAAFSRSIDWIHQGNEVASGFNQFLHLVAPDGTEGWGDCTEEPNKGSIEITRNIRLGFCLRVVIYQVESLAVWNRVSEEVRRYKLHFIGSRQTRTFNHSVCAINI